MAKDYISNLGSVRLVNVLKEVSSDCIYLGGKSEELSKVPQTFERV